MKINTSFLAMDSSNFSSPVSFLSIMRAEWKWWLFGALFSFMLASVLASGWPDGLLPRIDYPFSYVNDGAFSAIQRAIEGWIYENPRSGYPFGSNSLDYPGSDSGNILIQKLLGEISGNWWSAHNLYYLLGFAFTFVAAFCVLRTIGLSLPFAFTAATLFDFLPFHYLRIGHLYYTWYFVVPVFYYVALKIFNTSLLNDIEKTSTGRKIFYAVCLLSLGSFGVYYAAFGLIVFGMVAISSVIGQYKPASLKLAILASCLVVCGVILNLAPTLMHWHDEGKNAEVAQRNFSESEIYGFKFTQLILPVYGHRIPKLNQISARYYNESPLINENMTSSLGMVGALGLLAIFGIIISNLAGRKQNSTLSIVSLIVLILIMFGTIGGFGSIFAQTIMTSIRAWNRITPFIGFGALLVLFMLLQAYFQKNFTGQRFVFLSIFISIMLLVGGLYDQTVPSCAPCQDAVKNSFNIEKSFVHSIEKSLPPESAVYQLPYMPFPEVPALHRLGTYDLTAGFLYSSALRWSYGGMKGRSGDLFYRALSVEPIAKQLELIKKLGFAGVYIDKRGYNDNGNAVIDAFTTLLGAPPTLTRADGEVVFFPIARITPAVNFNGLSAKQIIQMVGYDHLGARYDASLADGIDFTRPGFPAFIADAVGLSISEPWGRWSDRNMAPSVRFDLFDPLPNHFNLVFSAQSFGPNTGQDLVVRLGSQIHHFTLQGGQSEYHKSINLQGEKVSGVEFLPPNPTSPKQLNLSPDPRMLGIGLIRLRFEEQNSPEIHSSKGK
jgi:phosphoglycerol transferase